MKVYVKDDWAPVASSLTDEELVNRVEGEFENLNGTLKLMFERFKDLVDRRVVPDEGVDIDCPCCGTQLTIEP